MLQPRIWDRKDSFTLVRTRSMYVGESNDYLFLSALSSAMSTYPNSYSRLKTPVLPIGYFLTMSVEQGDTTLSFVVYNTEKGYDIPADSRMQLLLSAPATTHKVVNLNLTRPYHTSSGPIIATGRVNGAAVQALLNDPIHAIRIEKVRTNQSDEQPVTWFPPYDYREAFQKGIPLLFPSLVPAKPVEYLKLKKSKKIF